MFVEHLVFAGHGRVEIGRVIGGDRHFYARIAQFRDRMIGPVFINREGDVGPRVDFQGDVLRNEPGHSLLTLNRAHPVADPGHFKGIQSRIDHLRAIDLSGVTGEAEARLMGDLIGFRKIARHEVRFIAPHSKSGEHFILCIGRYFSGPFGLLRAKVANAQNGLGQPLEVLGRLQDLAGSFIDPQKGDEILPFVGTRFVEDFGEIYVLLAGQRSDELRRRPPFQMEVQLDFLLGLKDAHRKLFPCCPGARPRWAASVSPTSANQTSRRCP